MAPRTKTNSDVKHVTSEVTGKFAKLILRKGDEILDGRGLRTIESAKSAYKKLIMDLEEKIRQFEDKKELMLDQSPDNRYSLEIGKGFDSVKFVNDYQQLTIEIANTKFELSIAIANYDELFQ